MPILPIWIKPLGIILFLVGVCYAGWHERDIRADAEMATYKASIAQAQADFAQKNAQTVIAQAQVTTKSEQDHAQAITTLNAYWADILRKRSAGSGRAVPQVPATPRSIDAIPTQCIPLAASASQDVQQLIDLQAWIRAQQATPQ